MAGIWWAEDSCQLKDYRASTIRTKSVVKIELEINDPAHLSFLLQDLERTIEEQRKQRRRRAAPERELLPEPETRRLGKTDRLMIADQRKAR